MEFFLSLSNIKLDIDYVRSQFPAFKDPLCKNWSFFENAGGSYVPENVINKLTKFMISTKVQPYAQYPMSKIAGDQMDEATHLFSKMINAKNNEYCSEKDIKIAHVLIFIFFISCVDEFLHKVSLFSVTKYSIDREIA